MIDKTSTALIVALISILGLTSCIRYNVAEPLDRFSSPEMGTADGNEITVTAGSTWFAEGEYENFILTGQALTGENAEAALLFHHTDGKSGYEVASGTEPSTAHVKAAASHPCVTSTVH